jgi:hypothetical protein
LRFFLPLPHPHHIGNQVLEPKATRKGEKQESWERER